MTSLVKALKAVEKVKVLVTMEVVRPRKAQAPTGKGLRTRPAIVERKIESNCQACIVTSGGLGTNRRTIKPIEMDNMRGSTLTPPPLDCGSFADSTTLLSSDADDLIFVALMGALLGFEKGSNLKDKEVERGNRAVEERKKCGGGGVEAKKSEGRGLGRE